MYCAPCFSIFMIHHCMIMRCCVNRFEDMHGRAISAQFGCFLLLVSDLPRWGGSIAVHTDR